MMSGSFVLMDTIDKASDAIFVDSYAGTDTDVTGNDLASASRAIGEGCRSEEMLDRVRGRGGRDRHRVGLGLRRLLCRTARRSTPAVPSSRSASNGAEFDRFNPLNLVEALAERDGEVVVAESSPTTRKFAARRADRRRGARPRLEFELVGIAKYGERSSIGGTVFVIFDVPTAQRLWPRGTADPVQAAAAEGTTPEQLTQRIQAALGADLTVRSGSSRRTRSRARSPPPRYRYFLLRSPQSPSSSARSSSSMPSITVASGHGIATSASAPRGAGCCTQTSRARDRSRGVARRAVRRLGLAVGLNELFRALNLDLPQPETVFATRTIVVSLLVGTLVTLVAGLHRRSGTRVPPMPPFARARRCRRDASPASRRTWPSISPCSRCFSPSPPGRGGRDRPR